MGSQCLNNTPIGTERDTQHPVGTCLFYRFSTASQHILVIIVDSFVEYSNLNAVRRLPVTALEHEEGRGKGDFQMKKKRGQGEEERVCGNVGKKEKIKKKV